MRKAYPVTLTVEEVEKIANEHIPTVDKLYRMFAETSSRLTRYEDGILYLKIKTTERKIPATPERALQFVSSWIYHNKELKGAIGYVVSFYKTKFTGFALSSAEANQDTLKAICDQIKASSKEKPELINIFSGLLPEKSIS
jgi:hypothetical protein